MRVYYVMENGFLFQSVPDGQKGQKVQLVIPNAFRQTFLQYARQPSQSSFREDENLT